MTAAHLLNNVVEIVALRLDVGAPVVGALATQLSEAERCRADRFAFETDRQRFIVGRARLRQLLGARLDVQPESVELISGPYGKPALAPPFADPDLRFNLSHSGNIAAYAFSHGHEVGIDIEAIRTLSEADEIAASTFSRSENAAYLALSPSDRMQGFFNCWTRKEAFIKAVGDGLSYPLDRFDVSLAPGKPARIISIDNAAAGDFGWEMESFSPAPGFVGAVVVERSKGYAGRL